MASFAGRWDRRRREQRRGRLRPRPTRDLPPPPGLLLAPLALLGRVEPSHNVARCRVLLRLCELLPCSGGPKRAVCLRDRSHRPRQLDARARRELADGLGARRRRVGRRGVLKDGDLEGALT